MTKEEKKAKEERIEAWRLDIMEKLEDENLTSEQRLAYKYALVKRAWIDHVNELYDKRLEEAERELELAEQTLKAIEKTEQFKQKRITAMIKILQRGLLSDEEVAEIFQVDMEYIQQLKKNEKSAPNPHNLRSTSR